LSTAELISPPLVLLLFHVGGVVAVAFVTSVRERERESKETDKLHP
jgi:hypothetical protein